MWNAIGHSVTPRTPPFCYRNNWKVDIKLEEKALNGHRTDRADTRTAPLIDKRKLQSFVKKKLALFLNMLDNPDTWVVCFWQHRIIVNSKELYKKPLRFSVCGKTTEPNFFAVVNQSK
ncbi:hypothetical protein TGPRC2_426890 [Toxoplasma gondii TgCatPRC2]|uniref:Uncharacterized protein n=1 Tax=Toxoplasma gondii TgCatPRC2 TaxID=1130821 RepID=A0A151H265_TOXGO|nr:hypothetical protein TGPRC2_426890 [Toxoplasma gondii TgCatPRC2]